MRKIGNRDSNFGFGILFEILSQEGRGLTCRITNGTKVSLHFTLIFCLSIHSSLLGPIVHSHQRTIISFILSHHFVMGSPHGLALHSAVRHHISILVIHGLITGDRTTVGHLFSHGVITSHEILTLTHRRVHPAMTSRVHLVLIRQSSLDVSIFSITSLWVVHVANISSETMVSLLIISSIVVSITKVSGILLISIPSDIIEALIPATTLLTLISAMLMVMNSTRAMMSLLWM
mmetsp:Transcript_27094/g.31258  ORF Transcript_27094/g.31258 Transcript_27094/m.31258 type:complete len:233 (+) Transcript_27094:1374-2072(+)